MPRPKSPLLTRDAIIRTALRLVDEHGAEALSTNRIAAALGVRGPSLYNHVSGRAEIIDGVRELLAADIDLSATAVRPWTEALTRLARSYRAVFLAHPNVFPLISAQPIHSPVVLAVYERIFAILRAEGCPEPDLLPMVRAVEYLVSGSVLDHSVGTPEAERVFELGLAAIIDGYARRLARSSSPRP
ncbi:TetR/AcrR family transcriptional regulator [Kutzneria sp. NPDC052558]|uniref:TetR/AcrR family transcriptional regulator n=1 Tax=Kutzneria sp. NPDC052558 TaxID=3364121 RepID=UPI0037CC9CCF